MDIIGCDLELVRPARSLWDQESDFYLKGFAVCPQSLVGQCVCPKHVYWQACCIHVGTLGNQSGILRFNLWDHGNSRKDALRSVLGTRFARVSVDPGWPLRAMSCRVSAAFLLCSTLARSASWAVGRGGGASIAPLYFCYICQHLWF